MSPLTHGLNYHSACEVTVTQLPSNSVSKMNVKYTRLASEVLTVKFSHHGNDTYEPQKFKDFQDSLTSNSKLLRTYSVFKNFPSPAVLEKWKLLKGFSRTSGHPGEAQY